MRALEDRITELHAVGDEKWTVLLAPRVKAFGCLRFAHIARSEPGREGFDFAVPANFSNGFFWAKEVLEALRTLAPARQRVAGLCFSDEGACMDYLGGPCKRRCRARWPSCWITRRRSLRTPGGEGPLSWRSCWSAGQRRWPHRGTGKTKGQMAFHYSSAKYAASSKIKSLVWGAAAKLTDQLSWEAIPKEELDKARSHGLAEAERLLRQDRQPIWASSQKLQDVRKRCRSSSWRQRRRLDKKQTQQHRR